MGFNPDEYIASRVTPAAPPADFDADSYIQKKEMGVFDVAVGVSDLVLGTGYNMGRESVAGLAGLMAPSGGGAQNVAAVKDLIPEYEMTRQASQIVSAVAQQYNADPAYVKTVMDQVFGLGEGLGDSVMDATNNPMLATAARILPDALSAATGVGAAKAAAPSLGRMVSAAEGVVDPAAQKAVSLFSGQSETKQAISRLIGSGSNDIETARFKFDEDEMRPQVELTGEQMSPRLERTVPDESMPGGQRMDIAPDNRLEAVKPRVRRVIKDDLAINAINQGFDEGVIADVKRASRADQGLMEEMVDIAERIKKNKKFGMLNRPSDKAGDTLMQRVETVQKANRDAGRQIDVAAESLPRVISDEVMGDIGNKFAESLSDMGIGFERIDGDVRLDFGGSDIEGLSGPEAVLRRVVHRMQSGDGKLTGQDLHKVKRYIDTQVTHGQNLEGLAGSAERALKDLRRDINSKLQEMSPEYEAVNKQYSDTIDVLDAFQDVAGKKMNLSGPNADKATGVLMRRLMGNAQTRVRLLDAINDIGDIGKMYGGKMTGQKLIGGKVEKGMDKDLLSQILFADEIDSVFGPAARTSLQGQFDQALVRQGINAAATPGGVAEVGLNLAGKAFNKARGANEKNAFKAIRELLQDGQKKKAK